MAEGLQPRGQNIAKSLLGAISDPTTEQFASDPAYMAQMQRAQFGDRPIPMQSSVMMDIPRPNPEVADMLREKMQAAPLGLLGANLPDAIASRREFRQQQQEPEKKGFLSGLKNFVSDPAAMAQMAIAFNSMRLKPDQGLAQSMQNVIERQGLIRSGNATEQALRNVGTEVALKYADAIAAYPTESANFYKAYLQEVSQQPEETFRTLSDEEKTALGLPEDGTFQISNQSGKVSSIGGSGDKISINMPGTEPQFGQEAAKSGAEYYANLAKAAPTLASQFVKLQDTKNLLRKGTAQTGIFAEVKLNLDRLLASMGDEEAAMRAADSQYLNALLGSDVFPLIASLGIGARGLDTPAERKFLQEVMTGKREMEPEALEEMTKYREKYVLQAIEAYNKALETPGFKDWKASARLSLEPIELDVSTRSNNVPQDKSYDPLDILQ